MAHGTTLKPDVQFIISGANFARDLFTAISKENLGNIVISPYFIYHCFGLLYMGAADKTADEMGCCLEIPCNDRMTIAKFFKDSFDKFGANIYLRIANKIFLSNKIKVKTPFRKASKTYFNTEEQVVGFERTELVAETINNFVKCKTENKICDIINEDMIDEDTLLVVVSAIYFKGLWKVPFRREKTCKRPFWISAKQNRLVNMMHYEGQIKCNPHCPQLGASIIELDYDGPGHLSLMVILPLQRHSLKKLERNFRRSNLLCISAHMERKATILDLPKFSLECFNDLMLPFEELGMDAIFKDDADFSNITNDEGLCVTRMVHKAFIEIDEEGCSKATPSNGCCFTPPNCVEFEFKADHPFLFAIKSKLSIIFIGKYLG